MGEYHALLSLAAASVGDLDKARHELGTARSITKSIEAVFYSDWAEQIVGLRSHGTTRKLVDEAAALLARADERGFLHSFVLAYRAHPDVLGLVASDAHACQLAWQVIKGAEDEALGRRFKLAFAADNDDHHPLTAREVEVLRLLAEGLSNAEIATRLVISHSTAKVHVHHILEKAGAANRLQAVRKFERLLTEQ